MVLKEPTLLLLLLASLIYFFLGEIVDDKIDVTNCFALPFEEDPKDKKGRNRAFAEFEVCRQSFLGKTVFWINEKDMDFVVICNSFDFF